MVVRVYDPNKGGFVPYVPPSSPSSPSKPSGGGGGGGGSSPPSSPSTVYIYKGKEYYSEADVKNAIAGNILESNSVQTILKKQGGSSENIYVYGGSTYSSQAEVQAQISKETAESPKVQEMIVGQETKQSIGYNQPSFGVQKYVTPSSVQNVSSFDTSSLSYNPDKQFNQYGLISLEASPSSVGTLSSFKGGYAIPRPIEEKKSFVQRVKEVPSKAKKFGKSYVKGAGEYALISGVTKVKKAYYPFESGKKIMEGKPVKEVWQDYKDIETYPIKAYSKSENIPTFYKGTGYAVGLFNPFVGGVLVAEGEAFKGIEAEHLIEKPTWKGAGLIAGKAVGEGALFAFGAKGAELGGSYLGAKASGYAIKTGLKEGVPEFAKAGIVLGSKGTEIAGKGTKNLIETYFVGQMGKEVVRTGKEFKYGTETGEFQPFGRGLMSFGSSLIGFGVGSKATKYVVPKALEGAGFSNIKTFEYTSKGEVTILREPKATQFDRALTEPEIGVLRRGPLGFEGYKPKADVYASKVLESPSEQVFFRPFDVEPTVPTFTGEPGFGQMFKSNLADVRKEGGKGVGSYVKALARTPSRGDVIYKSRMENPSYSSLSEESLSDVMWESATSRRLSKGAQAKLKDTIITDKLREGSVITETPESEIGLKTRVKPKNVISRVTYDPGREKFVTLIEENNYRPTIVENIGQRRRLSKEQAILSKKKLEFYDAYGENAKLVPSHDVPHISNVQNYFNQIIEKNPRAKSDVDSLLRGYRPKTKEKVKSYLSTRFAFMHDVAKRQSSSREIKGLEHGKSIADVYRFGYAKEFDKDFYKLPVPIRSKMIGAWESHTPISPGSPTNLFREKNPLAGILANADRYDFPRFGEKVKQSKLFKRYELPDFPKELLEPRKKGFGRLKESFSEKIAERKERIKTREKIGYENYPYSYTGTSIYSGYKPSRPGYKKPYQKQPYYQIPKYDTYYGFDDYKFDYGKTPPYTPPYRPPKRPPRESPYYPPDYPKGTGYIPPDYPGEYIGKTPFYPTFDKGGGLVPFAEGIRPKESSLVKSRPYRYTPNLIGIEFGKPIRKAPKGSKVFSGFELRPLVGGF